MRQGLRIVAVVAAISAAGTAALAWTPTDQAIATAQQGKVWYSVIPDPQGGPALGRAVVDINASPAVVWKLLMDCAAAERLMPSNRGCRVLKRDPAGRWDIREHIIKTPLMPNMRTVFREDLTPERSMVITRVDGDLKVIGGEWRLEPLAGGARTRVTEEMRIEPAFPAPGPMVRQFLRGEVSGGLANLKREAEAAR